MPGKRAYCPREKQAKVLRKDVSKIRTSNEAALGSEHLLLTLTEKSVAGIYVVQDGLFRFVNANAASYAGYKVKGLIGRKADRIVHPADRIIVKKNAREMLKGKRTSPYEFRIMSKTGDIRWVMETVASIMYEGRPAILGNSMDITERKLADDILRESERRMSDIIDFLPDATLAIDNTGKVITWNRAIEEMTGVPAGDMLGKGNYEYALPFYGRRRPLLADLLLKPARRMEAKYSIIRKEKDLLIAETEIPDMQGRKVFLWGKASPLRDGKGNIVGAIETIRDITDRRLAEEALRESERRLADIIDFLPDATLVVDRQGKVIAWNRAIEEMTGVAAKDMLGKGDYEHAIPFYGKRRPIMLDLILKPDKKTERGYYTILEKQKDLLIVETWVPALKGRKAFLWGKASPLYGSRGNIIGAIESIRDITGRKQDEEALKRREAEMAVKNIQLEELNTALRVLLKQREADKSDLEEKVLANVKRLIIPYLEKLKLESMSSKATAYLGTLDSNLRDIVAPFAHKLSSRYVNLTNREIQISGLIKESRTTKEISELLNISESAINIHRYNIRRKLGLSKNHNLQAYLLSLP
jgi:PAS domain S-box-containing protein